MKELPSRHELSLRRSRPAFYYTHTQKTFLSYLHFNDIFLSESFLNQLIYFALCILNECLNETVLQFFLGFGKNCKSMLSAQYSCHMTLVKTEEQMEAFTFNASISTLFLHLFLSCTFGEILRILEFVPRAHGSMYGNTRNITVITRMKLLFTKS